MSNHQGTTPSSSPEQTFEKWMAELQTLSAAGFRMILENDRPKLSVVRAMRNHRRRNLDYQLAKSGKNLAIALQKLHVEIRRGSFPGFGVAR